MNVDVEDWLDAKGLILGKSRGRSGLQIIIECPACGRNKLYVHADSGRWICYHCHDPAGTDGHGDLTNLLMALEGISFAAAKDAILQEAFPRFRSLAEPLPPEAAQEPPEAPPPSDMAIALPEGYEPVYDGRRWLLHPYLDKRGISRHTAAVYKLGYCSHGRYANRLVIPFFVNNEVVLWQARAMGDAKPKYLHPSVPHKADVVFGYDQANAMGRTLVVCEGPLDVIRLASWRIPAVALAGKVCSSVQADLISSLLPSQIVLMLDGDSAGLKAAWAAANVLGHGTLVAVLPGGKDPDESTRDVVLEAIGRAREPDLGIRMGIPPQWG